MNSKLHYTCIFSLMLKLSLRWWWWFSLSVVSDSFDPIDCSLPGSSVHGIFQARVLEWVAIATPKQSYILYFHQNGNTLVTKAKKTRLVGWCGIHQLTMKQSSEQQPEFLGD